MVNLSRVKMSQKQHALHSYATEMVPPSPAGSVWRLAEAADAEPSLLPLLSTCWCRARSHAAAITEAAAVITSNNCSGQ